ncbi:MAG TPA: spore protease YyaC [Candidatus Merdenecus merdavium]|nr:spore protease YyaC [Candidatus Merdenecus merdavium]
MKEVCCKETYYVDQKGSEAVKDFGRILYKLILESPKNGADLVFLCIGSDRVTGDSLGPLIGHKLSSHPHRGTWIYGTLEHPVHALNLEDTANFISYAHPDAIIIAIDASLGTKKHQGFMTLGHGPLYPGAGVQKKLKAVGDIFITGIINVSGALDYLVLQTTRLSTVMNMADCITNGVLHACKKYTANRTSASSSESEYTIVEKNPTYMIYSAES